jgi:hypothetical protein
MKHQSPARALKSNNNQADIYHSIQESSIKESDTLTLNNITEISHMNKRQETESPNHKLKAHSLNTTTQAFKDRSSSLVNDNLVVSNLEFSNRIRPNHTTVSSNLVRNHNSRDLNRSISTVFSPNNLLHIVFRQLNQLDELQGIVSRNSLHDLLLGIRKFVIRSMLLLLVQDISPNIVLNASGSVTFSNFSFNDVLTSSHWVFVFKCRTILIESQSSSHRIFHLRHQLI